MFLASEGSTFAVRAFLFRRHCHFFDLEVDR